MDITKAESYLYDRLEMLTDEKVLLITKLNKIQLEIEETESKIISMAEDVDKAFEVFSPRPKKNDFAKMEIERLTKHKEELTSLFEDFTNQCAEIEDDINLIREALEEEQVEEITEKADGEFDEDDENEKEILVSDDNHPSNSELYGLQILESQEAERKRIARDLHDSIVQVLTNLVHKCEICMKIVDMDTIRAKLELEIMSKTLRDAIGEMRDIIYDLRPMSFDDLGLDITLERAVKLIDSQTDMNVSLSIEGEKKELSGIVQLTIFRIVQECANNSIKYSKGNNLNIKVIYDDSTIILEIADDGVGFDYEKDAVLDDNERTGFGLNMMRERVALLSGYIEIETSIGSGTMTRVSIPVN